MISLSSFLDIIECNGLSYEMISLTNSHQSQKTSTITQLKSTTNRVERYNVILSAAMNQSSKVMGNIIQYNVKQEE